EDLRTTVQKNLFLRWVRNEDLPAVYAELGRLGVTEAGAGGITDVTSCPGTDTCKLGNASSRGVSKAIKRSLALQADTLPEAARGLHIKCSGCLNSCTQRHVADIGFLGVSSNVGVR